MMLASTRNSERQRSSAGGTAPEKRSLASILRDHGPVPVTEAVDIALDVCDELASAHANGIVHGDLGMHRVRTHWPRRPGQRVDIFALGENDSAAFSFRTSAVAGLVAPEQRENRPVDIRADVWAVGAMLHWMIAGAAPSADPIEKTLAKAPRTLSVAIEACLAVDPAKRPQSVNELAEVIASYAASPADRFEQLARRRSSMEKTKTVRSDLGDVERVLGRLDDAALQRELVAATSPASGALDRLMSTVHESTGSAIFEKSVPMIDLADLADEQENIETVLASPGYGLGEAKAARVVPVESPLSLSPVVLSSELLAPPKEAEAVVASRPTAPPTRALTLTSAKTPWKIAVGVIGAVAALSFGVGIGMRMVERALAQRAPAEAAASLAAAKPVPAPPATAAPSTNAKIDPPAPGPVVMTPDALPDARPTTVASLRDVRDVRDVRVATPASLPDAKPAPVRAVAAPVVKPQASAPSTREEVASDTAEASPTSLSDALR